jgi:hypothetical protein
LRLHVLALHLDDLIEVNKQEVVVRLIFHPYSCQVAPPSGSITSIVQGGVSGLQSIGSNKEG